MSFSKLLSSCCRSCRERFCRCQIHDIPDFLLLAVACAFLLHCYTTKKFVPAQVFRNGGDVRFNIPVIDHYRFVGGVALAEFDRRRELGNYVNLVCGTAKNSKGWKRGYKQTQSIAIAHLLGHYPLPLVHNGAMWFDLSKSPDYGLNCFVHLIGHVRHLQA